MIVGLPAGGPGAPGSYILHERAAQFYGAGTGWLSIKSFFGGQARYQAGSARYVVGDDAYLVLNHGRDYDVTIASAAPVESLCIFFAPGFAEAERRALTTPADQQLADPAGADAPALWFFERTYPHGQSEVAQALQATRRALAQGYPESGWLHEQLLGIMRALLHQHWNVYHEIEQLPAARPATREELYRRLHLAREFALASFAAPITLGDMAGVAGMSPNHLLRTFKQMFGQTPYQYLTEQRLRAAQKLLAETDRPITEICREVGFESLGAFSWLFRRRVGMAPRDYRRQTE